MIEKLRKIPHYIRNPEKIIAALGSRNLFKYIIDDRTYLENLFKAKMGKELDLENPQTFNEKLQWLKLYDRNPKYTQLVDKYTVRKHIKEIIGEEYLIPLLGVWEEFNEIDFDNLPNQFVLKTTHDSGGVVICKDKNKLNIREVKNKINKSLNRNYYYGQREWPYKNVKPRIIAEKYIEDRNFELNDYKFYCFHGVVHSVMVCIDRDINNPKFYFFDEGWNLLRINEQGKRAPVDFEIPKPKKINEMFNIAKKLSKDIPHVRVDLYNVDGSIYFGEMTFFSEGGFENNLTHKIDTQWGNLINLKMLENKK